MNAVATFNPVVSAADWFLGHRTDTGMSAAHLGGYAIAQTLGAIAGSILLIFALARSGRAAVAPATDPAAPMTRR